MIYQLEPGVIDIYYIKIDELSYLFQAEMLMLLNGEEYRTYSFYRFTEKKVEYLVGRYLLKTLLAYYLEKAPEDILITRGKYGKPYLSVEKTALPFEIKFNLSHSNGMVVCALTPGRDLGVDVEQIDGDILEIAERYFSLNELRYISTKVLVADKNEAAYKIWTMKEAFLKLIGLGLAVPLDSFDVLNMGEIYFHTVSPLPRDRKSVV